MKMGLEKLKERVVREDGWVRRVLMHGGGHHQRWHGGRHSFGGVSGQRACTFFWACLAVRPRIPCANRFGLGRPNGFVALSCRLARRASRDVVRCYLVCCDARQLAGYEDVHVLALEARSKGHEWNSNSGSQASYHEDCGLLDVVLVSCCLSSLSFRGCDFSGMREQLIARDGGCYRIGTATSVSTQERV